MQALALLETVSNKLESFSWDSAQDMQKLLELVTKVPQFKAPRLATAVFTNASGGMGMSDLLSMVALCTGECVVCEWC